MQRRKTLISIAHFAVLAGHTAFFAPVASAQTEIDHAYGVWERLLRKNVKWLPDNRQSRVNYKGFAAERAALQGVLASLSGVSVAQFGGFDRAQQMAFLINSYNAFTVELILSKYPDLKSIKDLGSVIKSPWKKKFFTLLGEERTLDWIEHEQLRPKYREPRIHAAVNCASIGCPALRDEAFTAAKLEAQLADGMTRFMADRTRNRFADGQLQVSAIFKWFKEDFEKGHLGFSKQNDVFAKYAAQLADSGEDQAKIRSATAAVTYLDYDWSLNDLGR